MDFTVMNNFLSLMKNAMQDADLCNKYLFGTNTIKSNTTMALSFAQTSLTYCLAAESIFYGRFDELDHAELPRLFHQFKVFVREVQTNCATNHSHQWSNIEFERLQEAFEESVCSQPIVQ